MDGFRFHSEGPVLPEGGARRISTELLATINNPDPMVQYGGLQMLCDQLTMSSFISPTVMATIPMLLPSLLRCIAASPQPEVSVTAARALTYILDAFPRTFDNLQSPSVVVGVLLQHLRSIEDVELSEQCITCLEIITRGPIGCREVLRNGGVEAVLGFSDFFTLHKQRQIWAVTQRLVHGVDESSIKYMESSLPTIRHSMTSSDAEIRQKAIATLGQVIEGVKADRATVDAAFGDSADRIAALLEERDVNDETLSSALSLLSAGVQYSADIAASVIRSGLFTTLLSLLKPAPIPTAADTDATAASPLPGGSDAEGGSTPPPNSAPAEAMTVLVGSETPESATFPSSAAASSPLRHVGISAHQRTIVCKLLASLLVPYRHGATLQLERLETLTQRSLLLGAPALGGAEEDEEDGSDDDEDYTTEDDEDETGAGPNRSDDDDESDERDVSLLERRQRIADEAGLKIKTKPAYARCRASGFMCDGCGKSCVPGDWFRCNECPDRDYCAACLLEQYKNDNNGQHTYTEMEQVVGSTARNKDKLDLYHKSPELLQRVLEAVPTVAEVCVSSEHVPVRSSCLEFLVSAVDMATSVQLTASSITNAALGDVLNNNIRGSNLLCNALAVVLAGRLLHKLSETYQVQFVREGVKLSLQLLKQRCKVKGKASLSREAHAGLTTSTVGWKTIIGTEASVLLHRFLDIEDEQSTEALHRIVQELRQDQLGTAVELLRDVLAGDVTAFEFYSSGIVRELRNCLARKQNVFAVMQLVAVLSSGAGGSPILHSPGLPPSSFGSPRSATSSPRMSPSGVPAGSGANSVLSRFVHHLHTVLTLLDNFTVPHYDFVGGVHKYFVVCFEPHRASVAVDGDNALLSASSRQRSGGSGSEAGGGESTLSSLQSIKARIRPLSSVSAMTQVLQQEVLHPEIDEDGPQETEDVTNVLPDLHAQSEEGARATGPTAPSSASATAGPVRHPPKRSSKNVWIRYGSHVLPLSMTMLQIIEHLVLPEVAAAEAEKESRANSSQRQPAEATPRSWPQRQQRRPEGKAATEETERAAASSASPAMHRRTIPRDTSQAPGYSLQKPVMLYYSTTPYDPRHYSFYKVPNTFPPGGNPQAPLQVWLPSQEMRPSAVREVQRSLDMNFPYSKDVLLESQRDVLSLLGMLYAAVSNWSNLLLYLHKHNISNGCDKRCNTTEQAMLKEVDIDTILSVFAPAIAVHEFQHAKLNNKAIQQCSQLLLAGQQRGTWAVKLALDCNFLFSFPTRRFLFDVGFTSTDRCLIQMRKYRELFGLQDQRISAEQLRGIYGQLAKESKRVWREDVLECAKKVLSSQDAKSRNATWSFMFYNENGWGDGPTREFYTLVSRQLRERRLGLWRSANEDDEDTEYDVSLGLYPKPCKPGSAEEKRIVPYFRLIGRFIGRALMDEHVPALPLSPVLIRLMRGDVCGVNDVQDISDEVGRLLVAMAEASAHGETHIHLPSQKKPVEVADLLLDFTLPGDDTIEMVSNGADVPVTADNMKEYSDAVVSFLLHQGVSAAVQALREGFHWFIPLVALQMLSVEEIYQLIAGHEKAITKEEFAQYSEANYGYTLNCKHVQWLFEILASFTVEEQKQFFLFLTGSAHLPVGGLGRLRPLFTIVRKTSDSANVAEHDLLPSAMTCQNYLKLPQYTTKEEMEKRLRFAMTEGNGAFLLS